MVYLKSVENVITLGKLIGLLFLFCLPLLSILFLKTKRNDLTRTVMGTIFLYVCVYVFDCLWKNNTKKWYARMRRRIYVVQTSACSKISFGGLQRSADYNFRLEFLILPSSGQLNPTSDTRI